jgi:hypothetical protein
LEELVPWCSGQTCGPVKAEIAGSNPVGTAKSNNLMIFHQVVFFWRQDWAGYCKSASDHAISFDFA